MDNHIDPLIAERAPWLYRDHPAARAARSGLHRLLGYDKTVSIAQTLQDKPAHQIMRDMGRRLAQSVTVTGLHNIPAHGPALIVANHPTGIADGIILNHLIASARPDAYFFANRDILRVFPQMDAMIAPVEWRKELRTHAKTRETMRYVQKATMAGRLGVIFPSGRLAKRRGLRLFERPWMASAAMLHASSTYPSSP